MVVMNIRSAITAESTLSFLGIGLPIEVVSWGSMLSLSEKALLTDAWWIIVIPGVFLVATLLCITELANVMRRSTRERTLSKQDWDHRLPPVVPIVLFLLREEPHNGLRRRCLLGALFARAGAGTDLPAVEQDMNVKFLAVVRASLRG